MSKNKGKDTAPDGYKNLPKVTDDDTDVEGHKKRLLNATGDEGGPEAGRKMPKFEGDEDDVEGHRKPLGL